MLHNQLLKKKCFFNRLKVILVLMPYDVTLQVHKNGMWSMFMHYISRLVVGTSLNIPCHNLLCLIEIFLSVTFSNDLSSE